MKKKTPKITVSAKKLYQQHQLLMKDEAVSYRQFKIRLKNGRDPQVAIHTACRKTKSDLKKISKNLNKSFRKSTKKVIDETKKDLNDLKDGVPENKEVKHITIPITVEFDEEHAKKELEKMRVFFAQHNKKNLLRIWINRVIQIFKLLILGLVLQYIILCLYIVR